MRKRSLFIGWLGLLALAGCGGGGGDMAATTGGQDFSAGAVSGGATGAGERALGAASADYSYPAWNPVASVIAYDDYDSLSGHSQIFTIPVGGGSPTRISDGTNNDEFPSYTSNGSKIAFLRFADR